MIFFKPENLTEKVSKFTAIENDDVCGYCLMRVKNNMAEVYELQFDEDKPYLVEGLLRTAFNAASLKNIYMGKCSCEGIVAYLDKMNFEKTVDGYINDIPSILTGSCCK